MCGGSELLLDGFELRECGVQFLPWLGAEEILGAVKAGIEETFGLFVPPQELTVVVPINGSSPRRAVGLIDQQRLLEQHRCIAGIPGVLLGIGSVDERQALETGILEFCSELCGRAIAGEGFTGMLTCGVDIGDFY